MRLEMLSEDHYRFIWAAYRRQVFENKEDFPPGLSIEDFISHLIAIEYGVAQIGGGIVVGIAPSRGGEIPVAMATVEYQGDKAFPHAIWFPEASHRNKLELGLKLFLGLKKEHLVLVTAKTPKTEQSADVKFFSHLCKYGVLRRVGTIRDYFGPDVNAVLFQSVSSNGQKRTEDPGPA